MSTDGPDTEWAVVGEGTGLMVGPRRAFDGREVRGSVRIDPTLADRELGPAVRTTTVAESGLRSFSVTWHESGSEVVAVNPAGGNRVAWVDPLHLAVAPVDAGHLTSVHVRFLLRHLTTALLATDLGAAPVHAVTATVPTGGVLVVSGPTQSGKTRLVNRLVASGAVRQVVDDDCPLVTSAGSLVTLVPRRYEVERVRSHDLRALVLLDGSVTSPEVPSDPRAFLAATPVPWPCAWLPHPDLPAVPMLPAVPGLAVPPRDEGCVEAVAALIC